MKDSHPVAMMIISVLVVIMLIKMNLITPSPEEYFIETAGLKIYSVDATFNSTHVNVRCKILNTADEKDRWTVRMKLDAEIDGRRPVISIDAPDAINEDPVPRGVTYFPCNWSIYWEEYAGMKIKAELYVITSSGLIKVDEKSVSL